MSLVERALQKLQATRPHAAEPRKDVPARVAVAPAPVQQQSPPPSPAATPSGRHINIDMAALRAGGLLAPEFHQRSLADQFRQIKRTLLASAVEAQDAVDARRILVASAVAGEGKTFTCVNLALSMALESDIHVVLIDADIAKPHISRVLQVEKEIGLVDLLSDRSLSPYAAICSTNIPRLSVVPAGSYSETASELLASARMVEVINEIAAAYENSILIFDSSPLLLTSESRVVASLVGQVALVVRAGHTLQQQTTDTIQLLGEHKRIGLILNQSPESWGEYYGTRSYGDRGPTGGMTA